MIRIIKGKPLPPKVRARVNQHPLGIAAHLLHPIGFAITVGALFVMFTAIAASAVAPIDTTTTVLTAAGTAFAGAALISQGDSLYRRVVKAELDETAPTYFPGPVTEKP